MSTLFPKMNPKQMQSMMRKMGIQQVDIPANEVIIKTDDKIITISNPTVVKVNMMGDNSFQISGSVSEEALDSTPEISDEDIETIVAQTGVDKKKAKEILEKNEGDIAKTIIELR